MVDRHTHLYTSDPDKLGRYLNLTALVSVLPDFGHIKSFTVSGWTTN